MAETKEEKRVRCAQARVLQTVRIYENALFHNESTENEDRIKAEWIEALVRDQRSLVEALAARTHARRRDAARKRAGR